MHELTIAGDILEIVLQEAKQNDLHKIVEVELEVGKLSGVDVEALEFAFKMIIKETLAENAVISIHNTNGIGECKSCRKEFEMEDLLSVCPICKQLPDSITRGKELKVLSIAAE